ncbi:MAG: hypothetical protein WC389_00545 [Lutibacter sp.]|jgi:hypothetical protein
MKNLENYGVQKMNAKEMEETNGGYLKYSWSGTSNPLIFAGEAVYNGGVSIANAGIWIWNQF